MNLYEIVNPSDAVTFHAEAYRRLQEIPAGSEEARRLNMWLRMEGVRCRHVR